MKDVSSYSGHGDTRVPGYPEKSGHFGTRSLCPIPRSRVAVNERGTGIYKPTLHALPRLLY